ncbi:hypothetical protein IG631_07824 [Alternaria alternata]|nr:hypothetical protein IG631_07824 [Alternaria alternata]
MFGDARSEIPPTSTVTLHKVCALQPTRHSPASEAEGHNGKCIGGMIKPSCCYLGKVAALPVLLFKTLRGAPRIGEPTNGLDLTSCRYHTTPSFA